MKRKLFWSAVLVLVLALPPIVNADLISQDLFNSGDNLLTLDTATGLEWLDVPLTRYHSYNDIMSGFGGYTTTLGFRYATASDIFTLLKDANIQEIQPYTGSYDPQGFNAVNTLMFGYLGVNWSNYNSRGTYGIYVDSLDPLSLNDAFLYTNDYGQWTAGRNWNPGLSPSWVDPTGQTGSYLVRSSVTPIPGAFILLGSGLLGLMGWRRLEKI